MTTDYMNGLEARLKVCGANRERLRELADRWALDARDASDRADAAEARVKELEGQASSFEAAMAEMVRRHGETHDHLCAVIQAGEDLIISGGLLRDIVWDKTLGCPDIRAWDLNTKAFSDAARQQGGAA